MRSVEGLFPGTSIRDLVTAFTPGWSVLNPSIAKGPGGYKCIVRSSNFVERSGEYLVNDPENIVRTVNYLCDLDDNLRITSMEPIDTSEVEPEVKFSLVQNMEDARLFYQYGYWWASGTSREHREDGVPKIALDRLVGAKAVERTYLDGDDYYRCEKNWMPLLSPVLGKHSEKRPWFVYSCSPSLVTDGSQVPIPYDNPPTPEDFRGSSQVIPVNGGSAYVGVTHEVTFFQHAPGQRWQRQYWHRFCRFDIYGALVSWSDPFYFIDPGIEFANGIVEWNDHFAITFGYRDERAMIATVPKRLVLESLAETPAPA